MDSEAFIKAISPLLKQQGFTKSNTTWRKTQGESTAVFNVQKSQWDSTNYYINLGVYFRAFGNDTSPTENKCHVRVRLPIEEPKVMISNAMAWFQARASLQDAAMLAEADSTKGVVFKELRSASAT